MQSLFYHYRYAKSSFSCFIFKFSYINTVRHFIHHTSYTLSDIECCPRQLRSWLSAIPKTHWKAITSSSTEQLPVFSYKHRDSFILEASDLPCQFYRRMKMEGFLFFFCLWFFWFIINCSKYFNRERKSPQAAVPTPAPRQATGSPRGDPTQPQALHKPPGHWAQP